MHKPESVLENKTHKILCDFEIQTDHLIPARKPDLVLIYEKKKNVSKCILPFQRTAEWKWKKAIRLVLRPYQRTKKAVEHEGDGDTSTDKSQGNLRRLVITKIPGKYH